jgi:hypothetical protein
VAGNRECGNESSGPLNAGNFLTSYKPVSFSRRTLLHEVSKQISNSYIWNICITW